MLWVVWLLYGWTGSAYVAQVGLAVAILPPSPLSCWVHMFNPLMYAQSLTCHFFCVSLERTLPEMTILVDHTLYVMKQL